MPRAQPSDRAPYDPESSIGFLVYKVHQRSSAEFRHLLEPTGLTPPQFAILALLNGQTGQRQAALCERAAVDPNTMVGIVDRLEAAGLVARHRDPKDRRAYLVRITSKGRRAFKHCLPLRNRAASRSWVALSRAEQDQLRNLLRKALGLPRLRAGQEEHADGG
jgi:DNA-binding MarR family transcriptional regulator